MGLFKGKDEKALALFEGIYFTEVTSQLEQYLFVDGHIKPTHVLDAHDSALRTAKRHAESKYGVAIDTSYFDETLLAISGKRFEIPLSDLLHWRSDRGIDWF